MGHQEKIRHVVLTCRRALLSEGPAAQTDGRDNTDAKQTVKHEISLVVQWLRLRASTPRREGSVHWSGN